jgi:hypothetical protein
MQREIRNLRPERKHTTNTPLKKKNRTHLVEPLVTSVGRLERIGGFSADSAVWSRHLKQMKAKSQTKERKHQKTKTKKLQEVTQKGV